MIFLTGHHGSGKSTLAKSFVECGFVHIETGNIVREKYRESGTDLDFHRWAELVSGRDNNYFDKCVLEAVLTVKNKYFTHDDNARGIIIDGNRQWSGVSYLKRYAGNADRVKDLVVYLMATPEDLFMRQIARPDKKIPDTSYEEFVNKYLGFDTRMGLEQIQMHADQIIDTSIGSENVYRIMIDLACAQGYKIEASTELGEGWRNAELNNQSLL